MSIRAERVVGIRPDRQPSVDLRSLPKVIDPGRIGYTPAVGGSAHREARTTGDRSPAGVQPNGLKLSRPLARQLGELVTRFQALVIPFSTLHDLTTRDASPLVTTHLTDLFAQEYGADAAVLKPESTDAYRLYAHTYRDTLPDRIYVGYQSKYPGFALPFWELVITPGFVYMECSDHTKAAPLTGNGYITRLPRVIDALCADAETLENAPREQHRR